MESNKDDAQKCIKIAQSALLRSDFEKALRFVKKSIKLYPSKTAYDLEKTILESQTHGSKKEPQSTEGKTNKKSESDPEYSSLHGSSEPPKFTSVQKALVERINKCQDYYEILGIAKEADETEMKKAYRKMALQLHPDKNQAPGATDAFKAVGLAYSVLSDHDKRQRYDKYGAEGVDTPAARRRHRNNDEEEYEGDFDPQELFNMFFGGGFPQRNVRVFRRGNHYYYEQPTHRHRQHANEHDRRGQASNLGAIFQLLPLFLVFAISILGNMLTTDPPYNLSRRGEYGYQRFTSNLRVPYFVKSGFENDYKVGTTSFRKLEENIEADYIDNLRTGCYQETMNKEQLRRKGVYFGSKEMIKRAENMLTPSCRKMEKLFQERAP